MNVVVCVKQIPDPAAPGALDPATNTLKREGKLILDDSDAYGVEMALQLVEAAGGGEHLGGRQRVAALQRIVADEDRLGGAHRERRAQAAHLAVRCHRDERDVATTGLVGELQRHLDAVGVRLVEDQLPVALEEVR